MYEMNDVDMAMPMRESGPFAGLAQASGFSERECAVAARSGRLVSIIEIAKLRQPYEMRGQRAVEARVRLLELRRRMWDR